MVSPLNGSKKCRRLVSTASSSWRPERTTERAETRAVHSDLPPASAVTVSSSSEEPSDALAIEACPTGGASMVKIAWISVPSSSVTPTEPTRPGSRDRPDGAAPR